MRRKTLNPDESPEAAYGMQLRRSREAKGYTQIALAAKIPCHPTYISKIETATETPTRELSCQLDELLETGGTLELMWLQIKNSAWVEGFPEFAKLEEQAVLLRMFDVWVVPGLLQAVEYTSAVLTAAVRRGSASEEQASERQQVRLVPIRDADPPADASRSDCHWIYGDGRARLPAA